MTTPVKLRGHHLLCILTHIGKGYTPAFTVTFRRLIAQLNQAPDIEIVAGPDDICTPLHDGSDLCGYDDAGHCLQTRAAERDRLALADIQLQFGISLQPGSQWALTRAVVAQLRDAYAIRTIRNACTGCPWFDLCTDIAHDHFNGVLLQPPR